MENIEVTIEQLRADYNWAEVFADQSSGNTSKTVRIVPPGASVSDAPMTRDDVAEIIAAVNGENDGEEWVGLFRLKDGRYLVAAGGCDYTGWDCQAGNSLEVAADLDNALRFGLSAAQRERLGLPDPAGIVP